MISRTTHLTAPAWRNLIQASLEPGDVEEVMQSMVKAAKGYERRAITKDGRDVTVDEPPDKGAAELILRYTAGVPYKCPAPVEKLELPALTDLDACGEALSTVLQAEAADTISGEQARSYRETIAAAARVYSAQKAESALEALTERGSIPMTLEAGVDPVEAFRTALEAMRN